MRKILFTLISFALISCNKEGILDFDSSLVNQSGIASTFSLDSLNVTRDMVINIADSLYGSMNTNIWVSESIVVPNDTLNGFHEIVSPNYVSWLIIVDMNPMANWGHECKYLFVNAITSAVESQTQYMLPSKAINLNLVQSYDYPEGDGGELYDFSNMRTSNIKPLSSSSGNKWAVIISGGGNTINNHVRYWNDCQAIFNVLTSYYGYTGNNIYVLMADGTNPAVDRSDGTSSPTDLNNDGIVDIDYSATKSNISTVFNTLGQNVQSGDNVFIFVTDHGSRSGNMSYITLWGTNEEISASEFRTEINKINSGAKIHIVMEQCYSGGFISEISSRQNTSISTACDADELSYARTDLVYDEYVYHWTAAVYGQYPNGTSVDADYDNDGHVSMYEAFYYAKNNDSQYETPQYFSNSGLFGYSHGLSGKLFNSPQLTGPSHISNEAVGSYTLANIPPSVTSIQWEYSNVFSSSSSSNTMRVLTITNQNVFHLNLYVKVTLNISALGLSIPLEITDISYWKKGIHFTNDLILGTMSESGGEISLIENYTGAYGYQWSAEGFTPEFQGYFTTNFIRDAMHPLTNPVYVSVSFYNPLGEQVTFVKEYSL